MNTEQEHAPQCIGFIMDGNRRWASSRNLPTLEGHAQGYEAFKQMIDAVYRAHIPHMVCYAFSTENWRRTEEEVGYLMNLMSRALRELGETLNTDTRNISLQVIGEKGRLPKNIQKEISAIETNNHEHPELTVWVAISYGGRAEIIDAVNRSIAKGEKVSEESFGQFLWTSGMPDPDLIIRTSGELRTSNFLIWQSAYSELFFTDTLWPDFKEAEFQNILEQYKKRKRRKGA